MLHTTFSKCHEAGACPEGYRKLAKALGGVDKYGKDTPIPLSKIVETNGLLDAIWTLRCTTEPSKNIQIELACRCAEHVLHFYEDKYPDDNRPRKAIEAARACITDKSQAARDAAWAAAEAASYAALDALYAAEAASYAALDALYAAGAAALDALDASDVALDAWAASDDALDAWAASDDARDAWAAIGAARVAWAAAGAARAAWAPVGAARVARDAAGAARDTARDAAFAAWADEREWQTKTFLELLNQ